MKQEKFNIINIIVSLLRHGKIMDVYNQTQMLFKCNNSLNSKLTIIFIYLIRYICLKNDNFSKYSKIMVQI